MVDRKPTDQTWQSFREQQLESALRSGALEIGPAAQPLQFEDPHDDDWWVKRKLRREQINLLPPALAIRLDVETTLAGLRQLKSEQAVRRQLAQLNGRIRDAMYASVTGPPCTTQPLDVDVEVARWRSDRKRTG